MQGKKLVTQFISRLSLKFSLGSNGRKKCHQTQLVFIGIDACFSNSNFNLKFESCENIKWEAVYTVRLVEKFLESNGQWTKGKLHNVLCSVQTKCVRILFVQTVFLIEFSKGKRQKGNTSRTVVTGNSFVRGFGIYSCEWE